MNATLPHTLLLVDDHPMMRRGLRQLIELEGDLTVVGEANNGIEACEQVQRLTPDLVVLDNNMPQLNGVETLKRLRDQGFAGKVLLFTVSDAEHDVRDAMRFGADGYLLKDMEPEAMLEALQDVAAGRVVIPPQLNHLLAAALRGESRPQSAGAAGLTEQELRILEKIAAGLSNKQIGRELDIAEGTVKVHVKHILRKLELRSRVEVAVWAVEHLRM